MSSTFPMKSFYVRWRRAREFREYELFADERVGESIMEALERSGGLDSWRAGLLWSCPGCGDRTVRTEEFLEGLRRAEAYLAAERSDEHAIAAVEPALAWLEIVRARLLGCESDRVYIKDAGDDCAFGAQTYISRI